MAYFWRNLGFLLRGRNFSYKAIEFAEKSSIMYSDIIIIFSHPIDKSSALPIERLKISIKPLLRRC